MKRLSVIIPWRGSRDDHRVASMLKVRSWLQQELQPDELLLADDPHPATFNRGRALHAGVEASRGELLVFADADLIVPPVNLLLGAQAALRGEFVVPFNCVYYLSELTSTRVMANDLGTIALHVTPEDCDMVWDKPSYGGFNLITRENYFEAGGFEPRILSWGFEDTCFALAFRTLVGKPIRHLEGTAYHLWHPIARDPKNPYQRSNMRLARLYEEARCNRKAMLNMIGER